MSRSAGLAELELVIAPEDRLRAQLYRLLADFLSKPPTKDRLALGAGLAGDGTPFGRRIDRFAQACRATTQSAEDRAFQDLFVGLGRGELVPYGSYYLTGFLQEKPLARLRQDMARLGIARAPDHADPEDHIASVLEMMAGIVDGGLGDAPGLRVQHAFYKDHIASWAPVFFRDLEAVTASALYAALGGLGRGFLEIEDAAFAMI